MSFVLRESGLVIPDYVAHDGSVRNIRHANELWDHYGLHVHNELREPGDLIFFSRTGTFPTHVGILADKDSYIHSPGKNGRSIERQNLTFEEITVSGIGRALYTENPIGFKAPVVLTETVNYRYHHRAI